MRDGSMRFAVDFDGVIHDCPGFTSPEEVNGPPMNGAIDWLRSALGSGHVIVLHTCRLMHSVPKRETTVDEIAIRPRLDAIRDWFAANGAIDVWTHDNFRPWVYGGKPWAHVYIDDRAFRFDGTFPSLEGT